MTRHRVGIRWAAAILPVVTSLTAASVVAARTWAVPGDAPTIQAAVDRAASGDRIRLEPGEFTGPGNEDVRIEGKRLLVYSRAGAELTVLRAVATYPEPAQRSFHIVGPAAAGTELRDLTFARGGGSLMDQGGAVLCEATRLVVSGCAFDTVDALYGGAIYADSSSLLVDRCEFSKSYAYGAGGAVFAAGASRLLIRHSRFFRSASSGYGGAIYAEESSWVRAEDCEFERGSGGDCEGFCSGGGSAIHSAGALELVRCSFRNHTGSGGGTVANHYGRLYAEDCVFEDNRTQSLGGAIACGPAARIKRCAFRRNLVQGRGGGHWGEPVAAFGGAVHCGGGARITDCVMEENVARVGAAVSGGDSLFLSGCVIRGNVARPGSWASDAHTATIAGGGITIRGCTMYGNSRDEVPEFEGVSAVVWSNGSLVMDHSIIAGSQDHEPVECDSLAGLGVSCSDIFGNSGGDWVGCLLPHLGIQGNFSSDPQFCDAPGGDLTLRGSSPCAPGAGYCGLVGALGVGCDAAVPGSMTAGLRTTAGGFALYAPAPNPADKAARIAFHLPAGDIGTEASLRILDVRGRLVAELLDGAGFLGDQEVQWDGRATNGERAAPGIYFVLLRFGEETRTQRLVLR